MGEKILLIGGNYFPEPTGIGKYNGEMINWLSRQGNFCTVITTFPYYPQWKVQEPYVKRCFWYKTESIAVEGSPPIKVIRCPHYVPKRPSGLTRIISEFSFFFSAYIVVVLMACIEKFSYIITVAPPFEIGLLGIFYRKIRGGTLLYHIQDLQVDAARDLNIIKSRFVINAFLGVERYIINQADFVSTISKGMIQKVRAKCNKKVLHFPNWVDVNSFYPISDKVKLKAEYGFSPTDKIVLYSGAIGNKQGLEAILHSAKILEHFSEIKFAICGSGPYKENLIRLADEMNLKNVVFLPLQRISGFNSFLNIADLHLVLQKASVADLVLPSKLGTIFSVGGVAIVTASSGSSLHNILKSRNMGILIEPDNHEELVSAIINNITSCELNEKGKNARLYAENFLESNKILYSYFSNIFNYSQKNLNETGVAVSIAE